MTDDSKTPDVAATPTPDELMEFVRSQVAAQMGIVVALAPRLPQERLGEIAERLSREQYDIATNIMPSLVSDKVDSHPLLVVQIVNKETGQQAFFPAYKRVDALQVGDDPQLAVASSMALAFLNSPAARFLLVAHGFEYRFEQRPDLNKPKQ